MTIEDGPKAVIEQLDGPPAYAEALIEQILREYLLWIAERLVADHAVLIGDLEAAQEAHHQDFIRELPRLMSARGRLLVARADSEVVGIGALKPIDSAVAEIKRMYVSPRVRGQGVGREILERLLTDARVIGYQIARLESLVFMHEAHALYRSKGFKDRPIFDHCEARVSGLEHLTVFMELRLSQAPL